MRNSPRRLLKSGLLAYRPSFDVLAQEALFWIFDTHWIFNTIKAKYYCWTQKIQPPLIRFNSTQKKLITSKVFIWYKIIHRAKRLLLMLKYLNKVLIRIHTVFSFLFITLRAEKHLKFHRRSIHFHDFTAFFGLFMRLIAAYYLWEVADFVGLKNI